MMQTVLIQQVLQVAHLVLKITGIHMIGSKFVWITRHTGDALDITRESGTALSMDTQEVNSQHGTDWTTMKKLLQKR